MKTLLAALICSAMVFAANSQVDAQNCPNSAKHKQMTTVYTTVSTTIAHPQEKDIVDTAVGAGSFNTLVAAVKAAGLVDALKGDGPFTVFAPTDEAFKKLPEGTVETLLKPENKDKLAAILKYHVVSGKVMAGDVLKAMEVSTLEGSKAKIGLTINGANVVKADIGCSNGVIHVIDAVILPPEKK
jgi:uncharacterized surface protein with fasciclin (FAS1) repeats